MHRMGCLRFGANVVAECCGNGLLLQREDHIQDQIAQYVSTVKACAKTKDLQKGRKVHDDIRKSGLLVKSNRLGSCLVCMYAKCGDLAKAHQLFNELPVQNVVAWNALIAGCTESGHGKHALNCFQRMQHDGVAPDVITFTCILKTCSGLGFVAHGKQIHEQIINHGLWGKDIILGNALVDMYVKCGALVKAHQVLNDLPIRNAISWNTMMAGYVQEGKDMAALNCLCQMKLEGFRPDVVTFSCILTACGNVNALVMGKQIHDEIVRYGLLDHNVVVGTALVDMYAKCNALESAEHVLKHLCHRDVVSWNALIAGYAQHNHVGETVKCCEQMKRERLHPNEATFSSILKACSSSGALDEGKRIHGEIKKTWLLAKNVVLATALVDMYAKCGALTMAQQVLDELPMRDVISWSALIAGYAQQGEGEKALMYFKQMEHEGFSPNAITFQSLLQGCSHAGLVDESQMYFNHMSERYVVRPDPEHYACMVDLFGRAGCLDEALAVIKKMPSPDYPPVWGALLGMCQKWGNVQVGRFSFEQAIQLNKTNVAAYACMINIYTAAGLPKNANDIEVMQMKNCLCV